MNYLDAFDRGRRGASLDGVRRFYRTLYESQRWSKLDLTEYKWNRIRRVYAYARKFVPHYQEILTAYPAELETWEEFAELPILSREIAAAAGERLRGTIPPVGAIPMEAVRTSGTTGSVVESIPTESSEQFRSAISIRELEWANVNPAGSALMLRALSKPGHADADALRTGMRTQSWATGILGMVFDTGPGFFIDVSASSRHVAEFITSAHPDFILAFPSALAQAASHVGDLPVRLVRTIGETLHDEWRVQIERTFKAPVQDLYSSQEVGPIAASCPDSDSYHTMDEWIHCEVLRDDNSSCEEGEEGRVVVTSLHPYLTPFIRYELGDRAVRGSTCSCGRSLGVLARITGRSFGFIRLRDGSLLSASPMFYAFTGIPGLLGTQVVQTAADSFEVSVVGDASAAQSVVTTMRKYVGDEPDIRPHVVEELERSTGGKIERFRWVGD